jgi:hypothetical protein
MQALDLLDFSVIHLSAYERSTHKYRDVLFKTQKDMKANWHNIDPVIIAGKRLEYLNNPFHSTKPLTTTGIEAGLKHMGSELIPRGRIKKINYSKEALRTVVIMPFLGIFYSNVYINFINPILGGAMGAGHSKLGNRFEYLKTCFWSLYEFMPNIVAGVSRQEDVDWAMYCSNFSILNSFVLDKLMIYILSKESGLPFFDLMLITGLPKSAGLLIKKAVDNYFPGIIFFLCRPSSSNNPANKKTITRW